MQTTIRLDAGETLALKVTVPSVINLSTYQARIQVRSSVRSPAVFTFDTATNTITKSGQDLHFSFLATQTNNTKAGQYLWQLMLYHASDVNDVQIFSTGTLIVEPSIVTK